MKQLKRIQRLCLCLFNRTRRNTDKTLLKHRRYSRTHNAKKYWRGSQKSLNNHVNHQNMSQFNLLSSTSPSQEIFLGLNLHVAEKADWLKTFSQFAGPEFAFIVTPNVQHVIALDKHPDLDSVYSQSKWRICDSKVLSGLASMHSIDLKPYPGADIVADLLDLSKETASQIAIVGPDLSQSQLLKKRYPGAKIDYIETGMMEAESREWERALSAAEQSSAEIYLICLSFPKQELFANELKQRSVAKGLGLCVGASIDFLTDRQKRAPRWMRRSGLEWLFRLMGNPRRLGKRYLWDGPRILWIYLQWVARNSRLWAHKRS